MRWRLILVPLVLVPGAIRAAPADRACAAPMQASESFLRDFENLDWERFRRWFADDASIFFPIPEPAHRFSGRAQFEPQWKKVFRAIRSGSPSKAPPFHRLAAQNFRCESLGPRAALVSFTLDNSERTARRTLIWRRERGGWRIAHLHASNTLKSGEP